MYHHISIFAITFTINCISVTSYGQENRQSFGANEKTYVESKLTNQYYAHGGFVQEGIFNVDASYILKPTIYTEIEAHPNSQLATDPIRTISAVLRDLEYPNLKYFDLGDGIAILTPIEQFKKSGASESEPFRWRKEVKPSFWTFLRSYLYGEKVNIRSIGFVVSTNPVAPTLTPQTVSSFESFSNTGAQSIPRNIVSSEDGRTVILFYVYEFLWSGDLGNSTENGMFLSDPTISAVRHLDGSGVMQKLKGHGRN